MEEVNVDPKPETKNTGSGDGGFSPTIRFVLNPPGILLCINLVLLFLAWVCVAAFRNEDIVLSKSDNSKIGFFLFVTVVAWLILIAFFIIMLFRLNKRLSMINWPITMVINCISWAVLLLIASSLIADAACDHSICNSLKAGAAFGFLSMIGLAIQGVLHFMEFRSQ